jgi:serralysin
MPVFSGSNLGDILEGKDQDDVLYGLRGSDFLYGNQGNDILVGGTDGQIDMLFGGAGFDTAAYFNTYVDMTINLNTGVAFQTANGIVEDNFFSIENVIGGEANDRIIGNKYNNELSGSNGDDVIYGLQGNDRLNGDNGNDALFGGIGEDNLSGGRGKDDLTGGADRDVMTGGREADTFHFTDLSHFVSGSSKNNLDFITDFEIGTDLIDLSGIDANTGMLGNQSFAIVEKFSGQAGEFAVIKNLSTNDAQIWGGDVDGDGSADFLFAVNIVGGNQQQLDAGDFLL